MLCNFRVVDKRDKHAKNRYISAAVEQQTPNVTIETPQKLRLVEEYVFAAFYLALFTHMAVKSQ